LDLREENLALKEKIKSLEAQLELAKRIVFEGRSYWILKESAKEGPFCQCCYDSNKQLIRLQSVAHEPRGLTLERSAEG
jgi:hypothetical protein